MSELKSHFHLVRLISLLLLGTFATFIPYHSVKVIIAVVMIVLLSLTFKRFGILFGVLTVVFLVLPVITFSLVSHFVPFHIPWSDFLNHSYGFSVSIPSEKIYPTVRISSARSVRFNVSGGLEIILDPSSSQIVVPSELRVERDENELVFRCDDPFGKKTYVVRMGTLEPYSFVHFESVGLSLEGKSRTSLGDFSADCTGFYTSARLKAKKIKVDCTGAYINGEIDAKTIDVDTTGLYCKVSLKNVNDFYISANAVSGKMIYDDTWNGVRYLTLNSNYGTLTVEIPRKAGKLSTNMSGALVKVRRY